MKATSSAIRGGLQTHIRSAVYRSSSVASAAPKAISFPARVAPANNRCATTTITAASSSSAAAAAAAVAPMTTNPLITFSNAPTLLYPPYDTIKAEDVVPGITAVIDELKAELDALEANVQPTWEGCVEPLERIVDRLNRVWGAVSHLKAVKDTKELRDAVDEVQPQRVALSLRLSQSVPLYEAFQTIKSNKATWEALTEAQQRVVDNELRDFVLGGVALQGEEKDMFVANSQELSKLSTTFSNNVLDATKAYKKLVTDKNEIEGLPPSALGLAAQQAAQNGHEGATAEEGPWLLTLDIPCYMPVLTHCKNRALREEMYRAYISRASSGDIDNAPIIKRILELRQQQAKLLGYDSYAEVSLARKMATLPKAEALLEELRVASYSAAKQDMEDVTAFAKEFDADAPSPLLHWDVSFYAERMREQKYDISDEQLRPYFALPNVLDGLFLLVKRLFDVDVAPADGEAAVWHPDVRFFSVSVNGEPKAYFYLDPYSRPAEKRGGAWMDTVVGQSRLFAAPGQAVRLPVAHMVCNQSPPVGDKPSLMTFREVETLAHEFGHALQHMLTTQEEGMVAGINGIEWDAVEVASQFMENFCYDRATLNTFAKHYETGELLPEELYKRLVAAKNYRSGTMSLRQLHFACLDLELHKAASVEDPFALDQAQAAKTTVLPPLPEDRFLCAFSHIFAGGYAAGYFSYKWAEVLSADAFAAFEEVGLDNDDAVQQVGRRYRDTILALGGGRAPDLVFVDFRGREPSTEALLRHNGLAPAMAA